MTSEIDGTIVALAVVVVVVCATAAEEAEVKFDLMPLKE